MLTSGRVGYTSSLAWRSAIAIVFLAAAVPAEAQDGNWSGLYAGFNAGGSWGSGDVDVGCVDNTGGVPNFCAAASALGAVPFSFSTDQDGFIGGAQVGYNFQKGRMVFGFEADIAWTSIEGGTSVTTGAAGPFVPNVSSVSQELNWLGTVRGRLGYAAHHNLLIYATGGLAYGEVEYRYALNFPSLADYARASDSKTKAGWTVGGGGEYSFGRWSLKGEYLYYDLGEESIRAQAVEGPGGAGAPVDIFLTPEFETQGHIVRVGLNFKLGHRSRQAVPLK